MGERLLYEAFNRGVPLVEFSIRFTNGINYEAATSKLNSLAEDFHLNEKPWYDNPQLRIGSATKEALDRLFEWKLKRSILPGSEGGLYIWCEVSGPLHLPHGIASIDLSQPGVDDQGQWYD